MRNLLNTNYERETWINFLQNKFLPSDFSLRREQIDIDFQSKYIKPQAYWIGDCESLGDLAIIEIAHSSENDPRIGVSRDAFRLMAEHGLSKALFFFVSDNSHNYRFSLITLDLKLEGTDVKYKFSNPKRFSFFLGEEAKIHTPEEFLFEKGRIKDFEDLQDRFSIEVVNKEFYQEIQKLFYKLVGGKVKQGTRSHEFDPMLKLPSTNDHQTMQEFSVRLVGRLVFCWFLKKKKSDAGIPLIPENILSSDAIERDYYHNTIEPLFFELLNTPIDERRDDFRNSEFDLIPFLNGGLFDPNLHEDYYRYSPMEKEYKPSYNLVIPDEWLEEFITLLETYNFTIDENTSIDIDLSVDPEMLGRIFENLLAEINPETGNTARKATGSYYTPRPIVEYMVDESLIQYLLTKTDIEENAIRELLDYNIEGTELPKNKKIAVIDALDEIKVLDPACGSGAFPMGILQKMLLILQKVDPESIEWVIRQLDKIPNRLVRQALEDKLMNENWKYKHKMGIIQNAIYGVDIQPIATEISKLRLFLTLIVDEKIVDEKTNRNIHPLPNLSFKFVTANTLIGLGKTPDLNDWMIKHAYEECVTDMEKVREQYFYEFDKTKKTHLENEIKDIQKKLFDIVTEHQIHSNYFNNLISWNPFEDKASSWFDPSWMYGINDGFDIVIGNPPWGQKSVKFNESEKKYFKEWYPESCVGILDIFRFFIHKSIQLTNKNGLFCDILPDIVLLKNYDSTRKLMLDNLEITRIDHWGMAFENVNLESCTIIGVKKDSSISNEIRATIHDKSENILNIIPQNTFKELQGFKFNIHINQKSLVLLKKLMEFDTFGDFFLPHEGIHTGNIRDKLFVEKKINENCKKLILGRNEISRYYISWNGLWVNYDKSIIDKTNGEYAGLGKSSYFENANKIVVRRTGDYILAALDTNKYYFSNNVFVCQQTDNHSLNTKYILAILNSKIATWFYRTIQPRKGKLFSELKINVLKQIPIRFGDQSKQGEIINCVNQILEYKKLSKDTMDLEKQIDNLLYELYNIDLEEKNLIELS